MPCLTQLDNGIKLFNFTDQLATGHQAFFTTRQGGVSQANYQSLNLGYSSGDAHSCVRQNWQRLLAVLPAKSRLLYAHQVHGTDIFIDDGSGSGDIGQYDGLISNCADVWLMTFHADCLPVYMSVRGSNWFGLAHSGWRGTIKGIAVKLAKALIAQADAKIGDLSIVIGPGISSAHYEVSIDVCDQFAQTLGETTVRRNASAYYVDIAKAIVESLRAIDIANKQIHSSDICTYQRGDICYSYRRQGPQSGRMVAIMGRCLINES